MIASLLSRRLDALPLLSPDLAQVEAALFQVNASLCAGLALSAAVLLFGVRTPYGRYSPSAAQFGPTVPGVVDWVMHATALVAVNVALSRRDIGPLSPGQAVLLALFAMHYVNRSFVFGFSVKSPKPIPLFVMLMGSSFCLVNSCVLVNGRHSANPDPAARRLCIAREMTALRTVSVQEPRFALGLALFLLGFFGNVYHDRLLISLRARPGEGYKIPRGGLFEYVSGANFFCEICEWTGFALASGCTSAWAFVFCSACNIGPRALHHHAHYRSTFPNCVFVHAGTAAALLLTAAARRSAGTQGLDPVCDLGFGATCEARHMLVTRV
jgi:3-oxo-5-alpha-steroid 4-dehydrogenase 1